MASPAPVAQSFATTQKVVAKVVANPEVEDGFATSGRSSVKNDLPLFEDFVETIDFDDVIDQVGKGWRLEKNSDGYYRWRWQMKDENGRSVTYVTKSGTTGYKRGSKYVGKNPT